LASADGCKQLATVSKARSASNSNPQMHLITILFTRLPLFLTQGLFW